MSNPTELHDSSQPHPQPDYPRPPHWKRFLAFIVDGLIAAVPLVITTALWLYPFVAVMLYLRLPAFYYYEPDYVLLITGTLLSFLSLCWFLFFSLCRDGFANSSPGKRLLGLTVISLADGSPCTISQSMLRNLLLLLISLFHWLLPLIGLLGLLVEPVAVLSNPRGWRYGDRWAQTQVVERQIIGTL